MLLREPVVLMSLPVKWVGEQECNLLFYDLDLKQLIPVLPGYI